jgi:hypothetical protein
MKDRPEFLLIVPLVKGPKKSQMAFIAYQDENRQWQHSKWFELGFQKIQVQDIQPDGWNELSIEVEYLGRNTAQTAYKLISLQGDEKLELYKIEGFYTTEEARVHARDGDHLAKTYKITLEDIDRDKVLEIREEVFDEYFNYEDLNGNGAFEAGNQMMLPATQFKQTTYKLKKGSFVIIPDKDE